MSLTPDQPMSRRAAREAAARLAATGEVPPVREAATTSAEVESPASTGPSLSPMFGAGPFTAGPFVPATPVTEPPTTTGLIGPDGLPMSRRRLREQRATQAIPVAGGSAPPSIAPAPQPVATAPQPTASTAPVAPLVGAPAVPIATPETTGEPTWQAPEGHWTRQLAEQEDDAAELTASREVGGSPQTTASMLVLDHPAVLDLGGPLNATGEVLLTGSIPLSQEFARTGATGSVAGAELDDRFDEMLSSDSAPVKASAVASQHAMGSPIVANAARRGGRGMTVLLVSASVLAVLVTGLVVTAIVLHWI